MQLAISITTIRLIVLSPSIPEAAALRGSNVASFYFGDKSSEVVRRAFAGNHA
jgi:hypothetical protein